MVDLFVLVAAVALLVLLVWFCVLLPYEMAEDRNRSGGIWVLISLFGSPVLAILLLIALGDVAPPQDRV